MIENLLPALIGVKLAGLALNWHNAYKFGDALFSGKLNKDTLSRALNPLNGLDSFANTLGVNNLVSSVAGKYLGTNLTGSEIEANRASLDMRKESYKYDVEGMREAGLNPAMMYGNGSSSSAPSSVSPGSAPISDLTQLLLLPLTMKQMAADIDKTKSDTELNDQKRRTEAEVTKIQAITAEWMPHLNGEQLAYLSSQVDKIQSEIDLTVANKDYILSQDIAQKITNELLPRSLKAKIGLENAQARASAATAAITEVEAKFAKENGFLMSSNDMLLLGTYIASIFKVDKPDVVKTVEKGISYIKNELPKDFRPWSKIDPEDAFAWYLESKN